MRGQKLETKLTALTTTTATATAVANSEVKSSDWLDDADDWGSDEDTCDVANNGDVGSCRGTAQSYDDPVGHSWGSSAMGI